MKTLSLSNEMKVGGTVGMNRQTEVPLRPGSDTPREDEGGGAGAGVAVDGVEEANDDGDRRASAEGLST